ncbi:MAG: hypothetical protein OXC83_06045 [Chloroflexi bacterium]|nr:hypothetical protein [Chloroflexota bacterium]
MEGYVDEELLSIVEIDILGSDGRFHATPALLDTGCNLSLVLPKYLLTKYRLKVEGNTSFRPLGGTTVETDACRVTVKWLGQEFNVDAAVIDRDDVPPIIGMEMCQNVEINVQMKINGRVWLARMANDSSEVETP